MTGGSLAGNTRDTMEMSRSIPVEAKVTGNEQDVCIEKAKGKPVTLVVSSSAGGGYDTLARTLARFLGRHLPGNPIVIVRNMAGAAGIAVGA